MIDNDRQMIDMIVFEEIVEDTTIFVRKGPEPKPRLGDSRCTGCSRGKLRCEQHFWDVKKATANKSEGLQLKRSLTISQI